MMRDTSVEMEKMLEFAEQLMTRAVKRGAEFAEARVEGYFGYDVELDGNSMKAAEVADLDLVSVRAYVGGGRGVFLAHGANMRTALEGVNQAVEMARAATGDADFRRIAENEDSPVVENLYDDAVCGLTPDDLVRWCARMCEEARDACGKALVFGDASSDVVWGGFANSLGVRHASRSTSVDLSAFVIIRDGDDTGSYADYESARRLCDIHTEGLGRRVALQGARFLGAREISSGKLPIILGPLATMEFFEAILEACSADRIQRGRSFLGDSLGGGIAPDFLTVIDDATRPGGVESSPRDGEGAPRRSTTVIRNGIFESCLHNTYTALKAMTRSTGHCTPDGSISSTNIIVTPGAQSAAGIIADTREGIYVDSGAITPDIASGDISAMVDFGFKIEGGEPVYPIINTLVAGRGLDVLSRINAISSDFREIPGNIFPTIRIDGMRISSSG